METDTRRPARSPSALDGNRRLAELLGWTEIVEFSGMLLGIPPGASGPDLGPVPDWTGDWRDCGPLMVEHIRRMRLWPHRGIVGTTPSDPQEYDLVRNCEKGESRDECTRRLIVDAVILQLEANR
jgi:hypothetical protein